MRIDHCYRYTDFKKRLVNGDESKKLNAGQHLLASASSGKVHRLPRCIRWIAD